MKLQKINLDFVVSGKVAAIFIASSVSLVIIGILVYIRKQSPWLVIPPPPAEGSPDCCGTFIGITLYGYGIWAVLLVVLYFILRRKENVGSIKIWLVSFLVSIVIATVLIEASFKWSAPI
jgi:hypothetical protein